MQTFNSISPWLLTVSAIIAVACGMSASPTSMPLSGQAEGAGYWEDNCQISFNGEEVDCFGDHEKDGVFQLVGCEILVKDPLSPIMNSLPKAFSLKN